MSARRIKKMLKAYVGAELAYRSTRVLNGHGFMRPYQDRRDLRHMNECVDFAVRFAMCETDAERLAVVKAGPFG